MTVCKHEQHHKAIARAVTKNQTPAGGVYTNELIESCGLGREVITAWLKANGYEKYGGHVSRYWRKVPA